MAARSSRRRTTALFLEALGAARRSPPSSAARVPPLDELWRRRTRRTLERLPAARSSALPKVRRMPAPPLARVDRRPRDAGARLRHRLDRLQGGGARRCDRESRSGRATSRTNGDPVGAAQALDAAVRRGPGGAAAACRGFGATGSGREIVGSLLATCYGRERGLRAQRDRRPRRRARCTTTPRVDTIFEIGGQDAKYIRLAEGRVVDAR